MVVQSRDLRGVNVEQEKRGIQSVEVGGQLLLAMADQAKPMMLRDIAALAEMPRPRLTRIS